MPAQNSTAFLHPSGITLLNEHLGIKAGRKFGHLTVRGKLFRKGGQWSCMCECQCGKWVLTSLYHLRDGHTRSCGCSRGQLTSTRRGTFLVSGVSVRNRHLGVGEGSRFGRLIVDGSLFRRHSTQGKAWSCVCVCECGNTVIASVYGLLKGHVNSCGCGKSERIAKTKPGTIHGLKRHQLYKVWSSMRERCAGKHKSSRKYYHDKGVRVCDEWESSVQAFVEWAIANGWRPGLQIDRYPNNQGNYEPGNCRFVTSLENNNNKCNNRHLEIFGELKTISEWARDPRMATTESAFRQRILKGWSPEVALTTPLHTNKSHPKGESS